MLVSSQQSHLADLMDNILFAYHQDSMECTPFSLQCMEEKLAFQLLSLECKTIVTVIISWMHN